MKLKLPYGISHYKTVIEEGYTYVDKTGWIQTLEDASRYNLIMRPRRFGKSLFVSMLAYYYDIKAKDDFNRLFGHLAAGQNPTGNQNRYQVLFMEFSGISTDNSQSIETAFIHKIDNFLKRFATQYDYPQPAYEQITAAQTAAGKLEALFTFARDQKIYLIIDEYDHFANALLVKSQEHFQAVMGKGGFVRAFYEIIKAGTQLGIIDRLLITGVTPLTLDSLTSGFNIATDLSLDKRFNAAIGLTHAETLGLVTAATQGCPTPPEHIMADIARWYNGYVFSAETLDQTLFNANMILHFLRYFDPQQCTYPQQMLDENIASDYNKILGMFAIGDADTNHAVLEEILTEGSVTAIQSRKIDFDKGFTRDDFISLLNYMGFISPVANEFGVLRYRIPNYVIKTLYFDYFKVELERRNQLSLPMQSMQQAVGALALRNEIEPLRQEIQRLLQILSNRDFMQMDEKHLKVLLVTLLYQSSAYFIKSEPEVNHKYPDILLLERSPYQVKHQHLIELKYCKKSERKKHPHLWDDKRAEGIQQVQGYQQLPDIQILEKLSCWVIVTDGEEVVAEQV